LKNKAIDIYFFTGTGNTYLAAKKIGETLYKNGCAVSVNDIVKSEPEKIDLSNTIGICFPVAACNTYPVVKKFINSLPRADGTKAFIFTTMGDFSLNAAANFGNILKNKGYLLIGAQDFLMPNNFIGVQEKSRNTAKIEKSYIKMENYAKALIDGTTNAKSTNLFFKICFAISDFIINRWQGNLFQKIIKFKITKHKCAKCGFCTKICPVKNISYESGYPAFNGKKCQLCMRCISYCPSYAIKSFLKRKTYRALSNEEARKCFL
jgi:ferredoxin